MTTPDLAQTLGLTEAEWLACPNPVRLVKRFRDRGSGRRYVLLACAYALDTPHVSLRGPGREIVEAVRRVTVEAPPAGWPVVHTHARLILALAGASPNGLPLFAYGGLTPYAMNLVGPGGRVVNEVVRTALHHTYGWRAVNHVSATVESHVRRETHREVRDQLDRVCRRPPPRGPREAVLRLLPDEDRHELGRVDWHADDTLVPGRILRRVQAVATKTRIAEIRQVMAELVRDVIGNPFRPIAIEPDWLRWNYGAVRHIAEQIAATGNFADMPVLADALEDAGCCDEALLRHCREEPHVPGCRALDAVLGR